MPGPGGEQLLTAQEVAQRLAVPVSWEYAVAAQGRLPSYEVCYYDTSGPPGQESIWSTNSRVLRSPGVIDHLRWIEALRERVT